jgi:hypothetical protein
MSRIAVIHQPDFMPYLGFFQRLLHTDAFVYLDTVQYVDRGWINRDKIKTPKGEKWISVSVKNAPRDTPINRIELSDTNDWREGNLSLLRANYSAAPFFKEIFPSIEALYAGGFTMLAEFNIASINMLCGMLGIEIKEVIHASQLEPTTFKSNELLVKILKEIGADRYLSGVGARAYFRPEPFEQAGIEVTWQDFLHPVYPQLHGDFIPYLSSIDLLFNCGIARSREILRKL